MMFQATHNPKWFQFRRRLARAIVKIASFIYPESPDVKAFHLQLFYDSLIYGKAVVRMNPTHKDPKQ